MVFAGINVTSTEFFPQSPSVGLDFVLHLHNDEYASSLLEKMGSSAHSHFQPRFEKTLEKKRNNNKLNPIECVAGSTGGLRPTFP